jgi:hypothetical protein
VQNQGPLARNYQQGPFRGCVGLGVAAASSLTHFAPSSRHRRTGVDNTKWVDKVSPPLYVVSDSIPSRQAQGQFARLPPPKRLFWHRLPSSDTKWPHHRQSFSQRT